MLHTVIHLKDRYPFLGEDGRDPIVECYLPEQMAEMGWQDRKRPCLVICPGGGYGMVSRREAEPIALHFLPEGYNVFVLTYSVAPHRFPVQLQEVAAVMETIYECAEQWHCDTGRIALLGFSAGGHLAAHYSNCWNIPQVRQVFPDSKPVQASVLCYPVISADEKIAHLGSFYNLLGVDALTDAQVEQFSCDRLVTAQTPPAFVWHTAADALVPVANSLRYATALSEQGIAFALHIYPDGAHGLSTVDGQTNNPLPERVTRAAKWLDEVKKWLSDLFKK